MAAPRYAFHPLTADRWDDLERLFGPSGADGGCWCMWWRSTRREFEDRKGEGNRKALRALVDSGDVPGILAYADGEPVGWCAVGPRESFPTINRSPVLKPVDERPVWSVVCFFVARGWRNRGLAERLLKAAVAHVRTQGGRIVEAYPSIPRTGQLPAGASYMGVPSLFENQGFEIVSWPSKSRLVMRLEVPPPRPPRVRTRAKRTTGPKPAA